MRTNKQIIQLVDPWTEPKENFGGLLGSFQPQFTSNSMVCSPSLPGLLQITWQEIMVGVESGLLMFPINILIITIFRSIRPRVVSKNDKANSEWNLRPFVVTVPSILKVCVFRSAHFISCGLLFLPYLLFTVFI